MISRQKAESALVDSIIGIKPYFSKALFPKKNELLNSDLRSHAGEFKYFLANDLFGLQKFYYKTDHPNAPHSKKYK